MKVSALFYIWEFFIKNIENVIFGAYLQILLHQLNLYFVKGLY